MRATVDRKIRKPSADGVNRLKQHNRYGLGLGNPTHCLHKEGIHIETPTVKANNQFPKKGYNNPYTCNQNASFCMIHDLVHYAWVTSPKDSKDPLHLKHVNDLGINM